MYYRSLALACTILLFAPVFGQFPDISFSELTTEDGLSSDIINCIYQDSRGFIWVGTHDGLDRYDGRHFKTFQSEVFDTMTLSNNRILYIIEDSLGMLWIFTNGGLDRYDPYQEKIMRPPHDSPFLIEQEIDSSLTLYWINGRGGEKTLIGFDGSNYKWQSSLFTKDGRVWLISAETGMTILDPKTGEYAELPRLSERIMDPGDKTLILLGEDEEQHLWIQTGRGIYRFDPDSEEVQLIFPGLSINNGYGNRQGRFLALNKFVLLGTRNGLYRYDLEQKETEIFRPKANLPGTLSSEVINCLYKDRNGRVWIGTNGGINIYDPYAVPFTVFRHEAGNPNSLSPYSEIATTLEDGDKGLWVAGKGVNSIAYLDYRTNTFKTIKAYDYENQKNKELRFTTFRRGTSGEVLISRYAKLKETLYFDPQNNSFSPYLHKEIPFSFPYYTRTYPFIDSEGNQYFHSFYGGMISQYDGNPEVGLYFFEKDVNKLFHFEAHPNKEDSLSSFFISRIVENPVDHSIWIGTRNGLNRFYPKEKRFERYFHKPEDLSSLSSNLPTILYVDQIGNIWIGHGYGYGIDLIPAEAIDKDSIYFIKYNTSNSGLPSNQVHGFAEDNNGYLWIQTNSGLARLDYHSKSIEPFELIKKNQFIGIWSFSKGESGRFYVGTTPPSLITFHPDSLRKNENPPSVYLTGLEINYHRALIKGSRGDTVRQEAPLTRSILFTDSIQLAYWQKNFALTFAALNFTSPEKNRFKYKLIPYDKDWIETGADQPFARYTNLSPGAYTFRVIAANNDGVWNETGKTLYIRIHPPWYWSPWSKVIYLLLVIGGLFGIYRWRTYQFRRRQRILEKRVNVRTAQLSKEKQRSDELLLNILPASVAEELKQKGAAKAQNYDTVTVLFTDFKQFTQHAERMSPEELVEEIDYCFKAFDRILGAHGVEKIKTIGDAYMAAAGLPTPNTSNPEDAVKAALAIRDFMLQYKAEREAEGRHPFEIRIGVHTGPVVAGIVGIKKFSYDIWGDTVNLAARMETSGEVGKVNISRTTWEHLKDQPEFIFEPRGKIEAKHKGEVEMYFVEIKELENERMKE